MSNKGNTVALCGWLSDKRPCNTAHGIKLWHSARDDK